MMQNLKAEMEVGGVAKNRFIGGKKLKALKKNVIA